jgi:hypothetical protein
MEKILYSHAGGKPDAGNLACAAVAVEEHP